MRIAVKLNRIAAGMCGLLCVVATAAEWHVHSAAEIARAGAEARPGDALVMAGGNWTNQAISFKGRGDFAAPITLRAGSPGQVILVGSSSLVVEGEHLVVSGIFLNGSTAGSDGFKILGSNCRLTESAVIGGRHKFFVHLYGTSNRVDHCYLAGKTNDSPTLQIEVQDRPNYHRVDHNHFGPRPPLRRNGGETIRVGYSHQSMSNSCATIEHNLFDRCDGELEIISNKSGGNTYRGNTFLDCAGTLTLRHGNRCRVEGNFFIGRQKRGTGGIRVIGEDHLICNNYFESLATGAFWITSGIPGSPLNGYFQARNCLIAFNTVVDCGGAVLELDAGLGSARRTLRPAGITIANNVFSVATNGTLLKGHEGEDFKWLGNLASGLTVGRPGVSPADLKLQRAKDGLWRPAADSPVPGGAVGDFPQITTDMDGQARTGKLDAGSDELSDAPARNRPLTPAEVGPSWRR